MLELLLTLLLNVFTPAAQPLVHRGVATTFAPPAVDRFNSGTHACLLGSRKRQMTPEARRLLEREHLVALWGPPCWSVIVLCIDRTGRCARATVADRGPRRAAIDVWHTLSRHLGHDGRDRASWVVEKPAAVH